MRKLIPILIGIIGLVIGGGLGKFLHSPSTDEPKEEATAVNETVETKDTSDPENPPEYVKMSNQFVVPVIEDGQVSAMVILTLSIEVKNGTSEEIYAREPKLRDAFLQVLFDHANAGGFDGAFTDGSNLTFLRKALKEVAQSTIGEAVTDVLVTDLARQDS